MRYDADFYRLWLRRALAFAPAGRARRGLGWLAGRYERVVERLAALPATFIHGEFYASNVLVQEGGDDAEVVLFARSEFAPRAHQVSRFFDRVIKTLICF